MFTRRLTLALAFYVVCIPVTLGAGTIILGIRDVATFSGSDIGAQINSAVADFAANGGSCDLRVSKPGTISTAFDIPAGCHISFAPGAYTTSITLRAQHRGQTWDMAGAALNCTMDNSSNPSCFYVGNNSSGSVSVTSGSATVNWVSGTKFTTVDPGDCIIINGIGFNVATVLSPTQLTLTAPVTGISSGTYNYGVYMDGTVYVGAVATSITIRNLWLTKGSGFTTSVDGLHLEAVASVNIEDATVNGFSNAGSVAYTLKGVISSHFTSLKATGNGSCLYMDASSPGGQLFAANGNEFVDGDCLANGTASGGGQTVLLANASGNKFFGWHNEGNKNGYSYLFAGTSLSCVNQWFGIWDERNTLGSTGAEWFNNSGCQNSIYGGTMQTYVPGTIAVATSAGSSTTIQDLNINGSFGAGYSFFSGATGVVIHVNTNGISNHPNGVTVIP